MQSWQFKRILTLAHYSEDLIGTHAKRAKAGKRGPAPKIQQQLEQIEALPKAKQRAIAQVLDSMLAQSSG